MQTATLINTTKRAKVIILDHTAFRNKESGFQRIPVPTTVTNAKGQTGVVNKNKSLPGTLSIPGGGSVEGLHPAIKNCSQVSQLVARGELKIELVNTPDGQTKKQRTRRTPTPAPAASEGDS